MSDLTIRGVSADLADALRRERSRRGGSLNQTVKDFLAESLGVGRRRRRSNGLAKLAGTWSQKDLRDFERAVAPFEQIDEELRK